MVVGNIGEEMGTCNNICHGLKGVAPPIPVKSQIVGI